MKYSMENYSEFLKDFADLIAAKSEKGEPAENAPFGAGVKKAFDVFKNIAKKMNFDVIEYDGHMGEISVGHGEELGIIGHLDVVPAPDAGWNTKPYVLTKIDGTFYGRGVQDDKGPVLTCLYALKSVIDEYGEAALRKNVRFFVGLDEESGWGDVEYFKTKSRFPKFGFSPDGNFPVVYAEKGPNRIIFEYDYKGRGGKFSGFTGGTVANAVCDHSTVCGEIVPELIKKYNLSVNNGVIESFGKAAHGSKPELGKNAILPILKYIDEVENGTVTPLIEYLFDDKLGITKLGNETGKATLSPDIISENNGVITLTCDFRVPAKMNLNEFLPLFDKTGIPYRAIKGRDPLYVDKDGDFVQSLLAAYNDVTGENEQPYSCSGATFSSVFECGCAFGPEFEGAEGAIHEPNEYVSEENLLKMYCIYRAALVNLLIR